MTAADMRRSELAARFKDAKAQRDDRTKGRKRWTLSRDLLRAAAPVLGLEAREIYRFWNDSFDSTDAFQAYKDSQGSGIVDHVFVYPKPIKQAKFAEFMTKPTAFASSALLATWCRCRDRLALSPATYTLPWLLFRVPAKNTFVLKPYSSRDTDVSQPRMVIPSSREGTPLELINIDTLKEEQKQ